MHYFKQNIYSKIYIRTILNHIADSYYIEFKRRVDQGFFLLFICAGYILGYINISILFSCKADISITKYTEEDNNDPYIFKELLLPFYARFDGINLRS